MRLIFRRSLLALALPILESCASSRTLVPATPEALLHSFVAALNHADVDGIAQLFAPNATAFLPLDSTAAEVVGADAIRNAFTPLLQALRQEREGPEYMQIVPQSVLTQRPSDALAIVTFDAGAGPVVSRRTLVIRRTPAGWRILHFHGSNVRKATTGPGA
jgi:ketosteroid isomerase-like protein